jgi:hypothetical protein
MTTVLKMRFHAGKQSWYIYEGTRMIAPIKSGDGIMIQLESHYVGATVGMDVEWYLVMGRSQFWLHPKSVYEVEFPF